MESSVCQFDAKLLLLHHQKRRLDCQLKLSDLHLLTLFQEMLLLKQFDRREDSLQEKLNGYVKEENNIMVRGSSTCGWVDGDGLFILLLSNLFKGPYQHFYDLVSDCNITIIF